MAIRHGDTRIEAAADKFKALIEAVSKVLQGQPDAIEMAVLCFLAGGHLLIEDVPGVGKTTLASLFANCLGLPQRRIQFTSDILPSDILGVSIYDPKQEAFVFHEGPIFTNILLADEINRAEPRAQSALLEAMFERQVSIDGITRPLPTPFMVIATQNPVDFSGTFPLPDSQLDRFLFRITMGYPTQEAERAILRQKQQTIDVSPVFTPETLVQLSEMVDEIFLSDDVVELILALIHATRLDARIMQGASTRALLDLKRAAAARALFRGRTFVLPDDILALASATLAHRIRLTARAGATAREVIQSIVADLPKVR